jgi:hypothetical protein
MPEGGFLTMPYVEYDEVEAICSDCGRAFRSEEALFDHRAEAHAGNEGATPSRKPTIRCSLCQKKFLSAASLREHNAKSHTG